MPYDPENPNAVRPRNFQFDRAFYCDGEMALMMGHYKDYQNLCVGMRWMVAEGPLGYPVSRGNPMWMVAPGQLALYMLEGIKKEFNEGKTKHVIDEPLFRAALEEMRRQSTGWD